MGFVNAADPTTVARREADARTTRRLAKSAERQLSGLASGSEP
jgi:hypothetical protein